MACAKYMLNMHIQKGATCQYKVLKGPLGKLAEVLPSVSKFMKHLLDSHIMYTLLVQLYYIKLEKNNLKVLRGAYSIRLAK